MEDDEDIFAGEPPAAQRDPPDELEPLTPEEKIQAATIVGPQLITLAETDDSVRKRLQQLQATMVWASGGATCV